MNRAVFIDRDGTIIALGSSGGRLTDIKHLRLLPHAARAIRILNKAGFLVIVHTNQTVIAWGQVSEGTLARMHKKLCKRLEKQGARIDGIYYCPHHPEAPLKKYRTVCECRKPGVGMIQEALKKHRIAVNRSFMVGDSSKDILAGKRAKLRSILVNTGNAGKEPQAVPVQPEYVSKDLLAAALYITKNA